jgi:pyruvate formate lyase activating enzyme
MDALPEGTGLIFDVKRFSLHDGPGIRTTIFCQGCPLRCLWCQNPESQPMAPRLYYAADRCREQGECAACVSACAHAAVQFAGAERHWLGGRCVRCGACTQVCPAGALSLAGTIETADNLVRTVLRDRAFYARSGGGVTLSGGEPLAQPAFAVAILQRCHDRGIHTALDTTAYAPWPVLAGLLPHTDLVLLDIKAFASDRHRRLTGVSNEVILANASALAESSVDLVVRVPVIPGQNDDEEDLRAIARFLAGLPRLNAVELLPYNRMARAKYSRLGLTYPLQHLATQGASAMQTVQAWFSGLCCPVSIIWGLGVPKAIQAESA